MPRISELPNNTLLSGTELLALVQDGETRQATLADVLAVPRQPAVNNARWIRSSADTAFINNATVDLVLPPQSQGF